MPNEQQHIQWALHNIDVITYLSKETRYCDWTATVSFYTALHVIEAVFYIGCQEVAGMGFAMKTE